jgi:uncharacterized membrane protein HdeD (DUF308 family)
MMAETTLVQENNMGTAILFFVVGIILVVGGWTYIFNYRGDGSDDVRWGTEALPYVIFRLMGSNRELFRILVCLLGIFLIFGGVMEAFGWWGCK